MRAFGGRTRYHTVGQGTPLHGPTEMKANVAPRLRPLHLLVRETEFCGLRIASRLGKRETRFPNVSPARTPSRARSSIKTCLRADEGPEFLRQSELIANIWTGLGAATKCVCAPGRHHYDVIADLSVPNRRSRRPSRPDRRPVQETPATPWRASAPQAGRRRRRGRPQARSRRRRRRAGSQSRARRRPERRSPSSR